MGGFRSVMAPGPRLRHRSGESPVAPLAAFLPCGADLVSPSLLLWRQDLPSPPRRPAPAGLRRHRRVFPTAAASVRIRSSSTALAVTASATASRATRISRAFVRAASRLSPIKVRT